MKIIQDNIEVNEKELQVGEVLHRLQLIGYFLTLAGFRFCVILILGQRARCSQAAVA